MIYVVATPIGNREDISARAIDVLRRVDVVVAEDTRVARKILNILNIEGKKTFSYHNHNEQQVLPQLLEMLDQGQVIALISDAGTPAIADPGYRLTHAAHLKGIKVSPIPGPSAVAALISASGLPSDRFAFVGFLPSGDGAAQKEMASWATLGIQTVVFFLPTRRWKSTLEMLKALYPDANLTLGRELTKVHEEIIMKKISELEEQPFKGELKGELSLVIHLPDVNKEIDWSELEERAKILLEHEVSIRDCQKVLNVEGVPRKELYRKLLEWKKALTEE